MIFALPSQQSDDFDISIRLDGVYYGLRLHRNQRDGCWRLDISSETGIPILHGIGLEPGFPAIYSRRNIVGLPPGEFVLIDQSVRGRSPSSGWPEADISLLYIDEASLRESLGL